MKVLLVNGSPHANGSTYTALCEVGAALRSADVETEWFYVGNEMVRGCTGCGACFEKKRCVFDDDKANKLMDAIMEADGVVLGSPVYYAGPNGALCALVERAFYASGGRFAGKVGASVVCGRRGGASSALERLDKFFTISCMPVVSSQYWNMVYGMNGEEVRQDAEGMQTMRTLGVEMARMIKALHDVPLPEREKRARTNFIR